MRRSVKLMMTAATMFSCGGELMAWRHVETQPPVTAETLQYPLNKDQQWYTRESYLIWKPYEDDLDYADKRTTEDLTDFDSIVTDRLKHPDFRWGSGVRVAIGKYLPSHDRWDVDFCGTYYYGSAEGGGRANFKAGEDLFPLWNQVYFINPFKSSAHWRLNYFTADIYVGRYFSLTPHLNIHPFIGVRGAFIFQDQKIRYTTSISTTAFAALHFKADHNFNGGGPRIGTDLAYTFGSGWSFLASLSGSFLYGRQELHEKISGRGVSGGRFVPLVLKVKDADSMLRTNIEGSIGLGWEKWVRKHTVRIAPSFQVEVAEWFGIKHWVETHVPDRVVPKSLNFNLQSRRRYSDLGLFGFNINLHMDF